MTEEEFCGILTDLIESDQYAENPQYIELDRVGVNSFSSVGMLTMDEGIVVRLQSGEEFQVTIVRSR